MLAEMRRTITEGKGEQWGLTKGARPAEQLEQLLTNLTTRRNKGEDLDTMLREFSHEDIATNTLRGIVNRGGPAALRQWQGIRDRTPEDAIDQQITEGRKTSAGEQLKVEAQHALAESIKGARYAPVERIKTEAETALINEGRFTENRIEDYAARHCTH